MFMFAMITRNSFVQFLCLSGLSERGRNSAIWAAKWSDVNGRTEIVRRWSLSFGRACDFQRASPLLKHDESSTI